MQKLLIIFRQMQYYMTNLLEYNCSISTIILVSRGIITKI